MEKKIAAGFLLGEAFTYFLLRKLLKEREKELACVENINDRNEIECRRLTKKWNILNMWNGLRNMDLTKTPVLKDKNSLAIYGLGELGKQFIRHTGNAENKIKCVIDKNIGDVTFHNIPVLKPDRKLPDIDAVIVSTVLNYEDIVVNLTNIVDCPIFRLEDIIRSAYAADYD